MQKIWNYEFFRTEIEIQLARRNSSSQKFLIEASNVIENVETWYFQPVPVNILVMSSQEYCNFQPKTAFNYKPSLFYKFGSQLCVLIYFKYLDGLIFTLMISCLIN